MNQIERKSSCPFGEIGALVANSALIRDFIIGPPNTTDLDAG